MFKKILLSALIVLTNALAFSQTDTCVSAPNINIVSDCSTPTINYIIPNGFSDSITNPTCLNSRRDGWYVFTTSPTTTEISITSTTNQSLGLSIYTGTCAGTLTEFACSNTTSLLNVTVTASSTYYLRISRTNGGNGDTTGTICIEDVIPSSPVANDDCVNAIPLTVNSTCSFTTYTNDIATDSGVADPVCSNYQGGDVWFSVIVPASGSIIVDTNSGIISDSGMAIYSGTCGSLTLVECDDDDSANGAMSLISLTGQTPGNTLYIRVFEFGNNNNGTFGICVTSTITGTNGVAIACPGDPSQSLTTDLACSLGGVDFIGYGGSVDTSYTNTLVSGDPTANRPTIFITDASGCAFDATLTANYKTVDFTVSVDGTYVFASNSTFDIMGYIVIDDGSWTAGSCPGTWTWITGDDDTGPGLEAELTANLQTGITYTFVTTAYSFSSVVINNQDFTWTVSTLSGDPNWYDAAIGGTLVGTGATFDPVASGALADTNTSGVYSFWADDCNGTREQADFVIGKVWIGTAGNSDWATAANWSPGGVPDASDCVIIAAGTPNDPIIQGGDDGLSYSLTIDNGASLTLDNSTADANYATLTIQDYLSLQGSSTLHINNNSSLVQINEGTANVNNNIGTGLLILDREPLVSQADYVYWSSPVYNMSISNIYGLDTPNATYQWIPTIPNGTFTLPPGPCIPNVIPLCHGDWATYSGNMNIGKGYISNGPTSQGAAPTNYLTSITGTLPNNGVITHIIESGINLSTNCDFTHFPFGDPITVTPFDDNWNLIGNPYPSSISANAFINYVDGGIDNSLIEGAVHIWTHANPIGANPDSFYDDFALNYNPLDYLTYNLSGTNTYTNEIAAADYFIGSGQGFFVLALNDNETGSVTFSNTMRNITHDNTSFYRNSSDENPETSSAIERHRIWLNISNENEQTSSAMVGYIEGATQAKDRSFDAYTFESNTMSIYSMIEDDRMVIQGRQLPFEANDQVPLGVDILQEGNYTISIAGVDGLFEGDNAQDIYLEDTFAGIIHDLRISPYSFRIEEGSYKNRFVLKYTNVVLSINEFENTSDLIIYIENGLVKLKSEINPIESVIVYNVLGQTLAEIDNINNLNHTLQSLRPSDGVLFVKAKLNDGRQKIQKIIY